MKIENFVKYHISLQLCLRWWWQGSGRENEVQFCKHPNLPTKLHISFFKKIKSKTKTKTQHSINPTEIWTEDFLSSSSGQTVSKGGMYPLLQASVLCLPAGIFLLVPNVTDPMKASALVSVRRSQDEDDIWHQEQESPWNEGDVSFQEITGCTPNEPRLGMVPFTMICYHEWSVITMEELPYENGVHQPIDRCTCGSWRVWRGPLESQHALLNRQVLLLLLLLKYHQQTKLS